MKITVENYILETDNIYLITPVEWSIHNSVYNFTIRFMTGRSDMANELIISRSAKDIYNTRYGKGTWENVLWKTGNVGEWSNAEKVGREYKDKSKIILEQLREAILKYWGKKQSPIPNIRYKDFEDGL